MSGNVSGKFFVMSERELFIITSPCERLRTEDDWCEFMTDNSSLTSHLVIRVSDIDLLLCVNVSFAIAPDAGSIFMSAYGHNMSSFKT